MEKGSSGGESGMNNKPVTPLLYPSFIYFCGLLLLLEWLYPLKTVTDTSNLMIFIIFAVFCFFITLFQLKWWVAFLLKCFGLLFILYALYIDQPLFHLVWLYDLWIEAFLNVKALWAQEWYQITDLFRSGLLLGLIWLMSYLIYYWFVEVKRIFLFILLTFTFITILDTFTGYQADVAIIRTFILSFIALGVTNVIKKAEQESLRLSWMKHLPAWIIPLAVIVAFSTVVGYAAPKVGPQWPDPVPFIKKIEMDDDETPPIKKVGYGEDDSQLGGSFEQDYTPVFQATAKEKQYWRIETKDIYTGKGWVQSQQQTVEKQDKKNIDFQTFSNEVDTEASRTTIEFQGENKIDKLIYPYGIREVHTDPRAELLLNTRTEAFQTEIDGQSETLNSYLIGYDAPQFSINLLQEGSTHDSQEILEQYTTLPDTLPERVTTLAAEIVENQTTRYDKVTAIEQYFNRNGFVYQTQNIPVPEGEQDYVDQFLFDSKRGYCDNFSTSMVVMLRTLDIPARWVKGFTGGEKIGETEHEAEQETLNIYEVTNANAHSWVEVYFPSIGWVPFEPTQGFDNNATFYTEEEEVQEPMEMDEREPELTEEEAQQPEEEELSTAWSFSWWYIVLGVFVLFLACFILYKTRFKWKTKRLLKKLERSSDETLDEKAYIHLLNVLQVKAMPKRRNQTLREYAKQVDETFGTNEMGFLTNYYEQMLYNDKLKNMNRSTFIRVWERLIKRIV